MLTQKLIRKFAGITIASSLLVGVGAGSYSANAATVTEAASNKIVIAGSTALLPLTQQAAKGFKKENPSVSISVSGSSSIAGPQSVTKGSATIGACDWDATKSVGGFKAFKGLKAHKIAVIPFATVVNSKNSVKNLTTAQLQGIFSGKIKNWKQVGGKDADIVVVNRAYGSGTRVNYQDKALKGKNFMSKGSHYKEVKSNGDMITSVKENPNAIGYTDLAYVKSGIKALSYNGVAASTSNVLSKKYPVYGYGYLLTKGEPSGKNAAFIKYIQGAKFQKGTLKKMKFIPISAVK
ncbi:phosphate ABC transporter substrate-binding protein [Priestia koreensis]|uniref:phosphate ABC transporter substrate-binding protein n=1 Tax=Priestia koreensis TaxID=284581 RepID=UPI001F57EF76|nr:phosphate ABC transporter substrate-binding protein [Priestia koreensis]UNL84554.1 phosphate ABC transporter substrate-binding protein [Priestia koreensis]